MHQWRDSVSLHLTDIRLLIVNLSMPLKACIVYTWDHKTSSSIWSQLKIQPIHGDEVMAFKALISAHKIIRGGHPNVGTDGIAQLLQKKRDYGQ